VSNILRQFLKDTGWSFLSLAVSAGLIFILRIFLARYYGAADLGLYTLSFTAYSFGLVLSGFGFGAGLTKYVAEKRQNPDEVKLLTTSGIIVSLLTGCLTGIILYFASPYIANHFFKMPELTILFRIVSLSFPFIALEKAILGLLNGIRWMRFYAFINIAQNILVIILTVSLTLSGLDIKYAVFSFVLPIILVSIFSLYYVRKYISIPNLKTGASAMKLLVPFGFYVSLSASLGYIQTYANTTLLGYFMTRADVGIFGVATTLMQLMWLPSQAIQMITTPMIASYWGTNEIEKIEYLVNKCMKWAALYAVFAAFLMGFLSQDILKLLFGLEYLPASFPLQIMLSGSVLSAMLNSVGGALSSTAFVKKIFMITGIAVILNIILNTIFIDFFGLVGAATATSISMIISSVMQFYFIQRLIKIKIDWQWFARIFSFALLLSVCTFLLSRIFNLYIVVGATFAVLIIILGKYFLNQEDRDHLRNIIRIWAKSPKV
jgi:O-antigen/teichoic acid export membrane protein